MTDNIMINGLYEDTERKAEKRVEWKSCVCSERLALGKNIMINGLYEDTERKAEKRVEW